MVAALLCQFRRLHCRHQHVLVAAACPEGIDDEAVKRWPEPCFIQAVDDAHGKAIGNRVTSFGRVQPGLWTVSCLAG